jgi:hypothetical protein
MMLRWQGRRPRPCSHYNPVMAQWRPLSRRDDPSYGVLVEGVPPYLRTSLWTWATEHLTVTTLGGNSFASREALERVERRLRFNLDWQYGATSALDRLEGIAFANPETFLDLVDMLLGGVTHEDEAQALDTILAQGSSAWKVARFTGAYRLERRVDATIAAAAEAVMAATERPGRHLSAAWAAVYGREPEASKGYREAVRAVEAAAIPVVSPKNASATLGTVIADIRQAPANWALRLSPPADCPSIEWLLGMLGLLWKSQSDRHGTPDETAPLTVSLPEAQDAVHLAVTLVQWFTSGAVTRSLSHDKLSHA